jgi:hypothetical protein
MGWSMALNYVTHDGIERPTYLLIAFYKYIGYTININLSKTGLLVK